MNQRYKPVTFINGKVGKTRNNTTQQVMLLQALSITQDPNKLRQMIGVKTVAEVFRTLDKMALRKDYQGALGRAGISFDWMAQGIKEIADDKDASAKVRLSAFMGLLKTLGMDKYDVSGGDGGGSWEDALLAKIEGERSGKTPKLAAGDDPGFEEQGMYEVKQAVMPESVKQIKARDNAIGASLYE